MIQPWLFEFFHSTPAEERGQNPRAAAKRRFDQFLDLWVEDEALGFEGIMFSEHHFGPGFSPCPNLLIAAMASRTSTIRLGVLGVSTAYATPLRIVEETAMLDNLTDGRLEFGMVRGIPQELELLGIVPADADARFDQTLRVVDAAFTSAAGEFNCEGLVIEPPLQQVDMPKWLAITSERSSRRAAAVKWKACTGFLSVEKIEGLFDAYRDEAGLDRAGAADMLGLRRMVSLVADRSETEAARAALRAFRTADVVNNGPRATGEHRGLRAEEGHAILDVEAALKALLSDDEFIVGTPKEAAEQIIEQCRAVGCVHFMVNLHSSEDLNEKRRQHQLFGEEVIPLLRKADVVARGRGD